jgi:FKBP-type peptidyl-prolyl cis-trans isomerase
MFQMSKRFATMALFAVVLAGCNAAPSRAAADTKAQGEAFLASNSGKPGVMTTASGLQYQVLKPGSGAKPKATDVVSVTYKGTFIDGKVFDQSDAPISFPLDAVIAGWTEGVQLMNQGATFRFFVPPALGYGDSDKGPIPGNSVLVFDVTLLAIN